MVVRGGGGGGVGVFLEVWLFFKNCFLMLLPKLWAPDTAGVENWKI